MAELVPSRTTHFISQQEQNQEAALYDNLFLLERTFDVLIEDGAHAYARAETTLAQKLIIRIRREIAGSLQYAAEKDLTSLRARLHRIHVQLYPRIDYTSQTKL
ncbi:MAG: hypothetical protein V7750_11115 [Sneathiella sp.]